jgi:hypothetical protein
MFHETGTSPLAHWVAVPVGMYREPFFDSHALIVFVSVTAKTTVLAPIPERTAAPPATYAARCCQRMVLRTWLDMNGVPRVEAAEGPVSPLAPCRA